MDIVRVKNRNGQDQGVVNLKNIISIKIVSKSQELDGRTLEFKEIQPYAELIANWEGGAEETIYYIEAKTEDQARALAGQALEKILDRVTNNIIDLEG